MTNNRLTDEQLAKALDYDLKTAAKVDEVPPWLAWSILALQELQERRKADEPNSDLPEEAIIAKLRQFPPPPLPSAEELREAVRADEPTVVHVDPAGQTREPPHCPTCECGMCGCPDEYCMKRAGTLKSGIRCADDRIKASPCDCGSAIHRKDCSYVR